MLYRGEIISSTHSEAAGARIGALSLVLLDIGIPAAAFWIWRTRRDVDAALLLLPVLISSFLDYSSHLLSLFIFGISGTPPWEKPPFPTPWSAGKK